jgi:hypothetical protein
MGRVDVSKTLGQLLQFQAEMLVERTPKRGSRRTIQALRSGRLRETLGDFGTPVSARTAAVLADAFATGRFGITATDVFLRNNGDEGMDADCSCKPPILAPFLKCELQQHPSGLWCDKPADSACPNCKMTIGVGIPSTGSIALAGKAETLGQGYLDFLVPGLAAAARTLSTLSFPIEDPLRLRGELQALEVAPSRVLADLSFPLVTEADALVKLLDRGANNLLRLAVGDYDETVTRSLAGGLASGGIEVDEARRQLRVIARPIGPDTGVTVRVMCRCVSEHGWCLYALNPEGNHLSCVEVACAACDMITTFPSPTVEGLALA